MYRTSNAARSGHLTIWLATWLLLWGTAAGASADESDLARGQYLVSLLGCGRCHTEGYLTGNQPEGPFLAGSRVGIAYTAYSEDENRPGVVFPGNLTGDHATGLGSWSEEEIIRAMTAGVAKGGHERLFIMPWPDYNAITDSDLRAIARFVKAMPAVPREIPEAVPEGATITHPYVRFGVYIFEPHTMAQPVPWCAARLAKAAHRAVGER